MLLDFIIAVHSSTKLEDWVQKTNTKQFPFSFHSYILLQINPPESIKWQYNNNLEAFLISPANLAHPWRYIISRGNPYIINTSRPVPALSLGSYCTRCLSLLAQWSENNTPMWLISLHSEDMGVQTWILMCMWTGFCRSMSGGLDLLVNHWGGGVLFWLWPT